MSVVESSGTQTAVIGTEHTLSAPSTNRTRVFVVDAANLVAGETVELRVFGPVLSGGVSSLIRLSTFVGVVAEPNIQSVPFLMPFGGSCTLKQTSGTGRAFPWSVQTLD